MPRTGAELLVETLVARGVRHLFTVSGNHVLSIFDATIGRGLALIHVRHEASAVHMADAWGRLTGEPGVALVTGGPGHLNAISALYGARLAESPVVLLSGHAPLDELGQGAFQEVDQVGVARPVTKAAWLAREPDRLGRDVARALGLARAGCPGPVHVSLPTDVLEARVDGAVPPPRPPARARRGGRDPGLAEVVALLHAARRPLILLGPAMARGPRREAVDRLAGLTGIPALPIESPRGVDDPALRAAHRCLARADLVLLLGKALDFSLRFGRPPTLAPSCRVVAVGSARRPSRVARAFARDPWSAAEQLAALAAARRWPARPWAAEVSAAIGETPADWAALRADGRTPIHPLRVCAALQPHLDAGGVLVSDGGEFGQWVQAGLRAGERLINGLSGSIGSAVPMALAARLARPDRPVLATLGDGTFGYAVAEFDTAVRYRLPVVAVVGNDARWNAEHQLQLRRYGADRAIGCELLPSRYERMVEALGGHGEWVERADQLDAAVARAVASGRPACVNVRIEAAAAPRFPPLTPPDRLS